MKSYISLTLFLILLCGLTNCKNEDPIMPSGLTLSVTEGGANTLLVLKGKDLSDIRKVMFGEVDAPFNPVYNTDKVFMFNVPLAAKFGPQKIALYNAGGEKTKTELDFKVLQPEPVVLDVQPRSSSKGELLTITGSNFDGEGYAADLVVTIGGVVAKVVSRERAKLTVEMPDTPGGVVSVSTVNTAFGGGEAITEYSISVEKVYHLIADFDGGGSADKSYWYTYGDVDGAWSVASVAVTPKSGKYASMSNKTLVYKNTYNGASHDDQIVYDLSKVVDGTTAIRLDANSNGVKTTNLTVQLKDEYGGNWKKTIKADWDGWAPVTFKFSDFAFGYGTQVGTAIDATKLQRVEILFSDYQNVAQEIHFDNIRLIELK